VESREEQAGMGGDPRHRGMVGAQEERSGLPSTLGVG